MKNKTVIGLICIYMALVFSFFVLPELADRAGWKIPNFTGTVVCFLQPGDEPLPAWNELDRR